MNGLPARRERLWMCRASTSLPVPLSPVIRMLASAVATCSARLDRRQHRPGRGPPGHGSSPDAASRMAAISSGSGGSGRNSRAPAAIASPLLLPAKVSTPQATTGTVIRLGRDGAHQGAPRRAAARPAPDPSCASDAEPGQRGAVVIGLVQFCTARAQRSAAAWPERAPLNEPMISTLHQADRSPLTISVIVTPSRVSSTITTSPRATSRLLT